MPKFSVFLELTIFSYLSGFDLLTKAGIISKHTRKLINENSRRGIMTSSRRTLSVGPAFVASDFALEIIDNFDLKSSEASEMKPLYAQLRQLYLKQVEAYLIRQNTNPIMLHQ
jgi:hypothetical protein